MAKKEVVKNEVKEAARALFERTENVQTVQGQLAALESEVARMEETLAAQRQTHLEAKAQAFIDKTPLPTLPDGFAAAEKELAEHKAMLPILRERVNAALTQARDHACGLMAQVSGILEPLLKQAKQDRAERLAQAVADLSEIIGIRDARALLDPQNTDRLSDAIFERFKALTEQRQNSGDVLGLAHLLDTLGNHSERMAACDLGDVHRYLKDVAAHIQATGDFVETTTQGAPAPA